MMNLPPPGLDISKVFWNTPAGKQALQAAVDEKSAARAALQKQVADAQAEHNKSYPLLSKARAESAAKLREAEEAMQLAMQANRRAQQDCDSAMNRMDQTRWQAVLTLRTELAEPAIAEFLAEVRAEIDVMRKEGPDRIAGRLWSPSRLTHDAGTSNSNAWQARIVALVCILQHEDELHLAPDTAKAIAAARKALPEYKNVWDDPNLARQIQATEMGVPSMAAGLVNAAAEAVGL